MRNILFFAVALLAATTQSVRADDLPAGSYRQTCFKCKVTNDHILTCTCLAVDKTRKQADIPYLSCPSKRVMNDNGTLRCD